MNIKVFAMAVLVFGRIAAAGAETLVVNNPADDGSKHTLRWAIETNNEKPGGNRILIVPTGPPTDSWVIRLKSLLPPIKGPAVIQGLKSEFGQGNRPDIVIDGSDFIDPSTVLSCPGETGGSGPNVRSLQKPALAVVDSGGVEISGLEIRNFCIGVMLLRSHDNHLHHNVIHDMRGAAGILITGDDGTPAGGATTGKSTNNLVEYNIVYDTGDGAECTRGTSHTTYQYNVFYETPNDVSPRSQGVECAGAGNTDINFFYNSFTGYSDGLQLNQASNVLVLGNTISAATFGITSSGTNVVIKQNVITGNRMGVGPGGNARVTITQNKIYDNGQPILSLPTSAGGTTNPNSPALLGIDLRVDGLTPNDLEGSCPDQAPDCDTGPNDLQNFPVLSPSSSWSSGGIVLEGVLPSRPNGSYIIEFFASHRLNRAGFGEGEAFLGSATVVTGLTGYATFRVQLPNADPLGDGSRQAYFTATATNAGGSTSEFSAPLLLSEGGN